MLERLASDPVTIGSTILVFLGNGVRNGVKSWVRNGVKS